MVAVPSPVIVISYGPPAGVSGSVTDQRPSLPATADAVRCASDTVIVRPGSAQPHTTGAPRCSSMWSPRIAGSRSSARAVVAASTTSAATRRPRRALSLRAIAQTSRSITVSGRCGSTIAPAVRSAIDWIVKVGL